MPHNIQVIAAGLGHSFFDFIKIYCRDESSGHSINRVAHRLCSLMRKMGVKTVVVEDLEPTYIEVEAEFLALRTFFETSLGTLEIQANRLTFISEELDSHDVSRIPELDDDKFLGSAILINFKNPDNDLWHTYIFNAIVATPKIINHKKYGTLPLLNYYPHIYKNFKRQVYINEFVVHDYKITGSFFCQQNSVTSVCAHAALCMTLNNHSLLNIDLVTPEQINKTIGIDHQKIRFLHNKKGLKKDEVDSVLGKYGLYITYKSFLGEEIREYHDYIYKYIESRCPVLLTFSTDKGIDHVVPILGHTLNSDTWKPEAELIYSKVGGRLSYFKSSSAYVDNFIIHDDNFGMYYCLPIHSLAGAIFELAGDTAFKAVYATAVVPFGVITPPREAEWTSVLVAITILEKLQEKGTELDSWSKSFLSSINAEPPRPIITRTLLVEKRSYVMSIEGEDFLGNSFTSEEKEMLTNYLPDKFWLTEMTLPDLYTANKNKIIDFFYPCDLPPSIDPAVDIDNRWIQIRLPGSLRINKNDATFPMTVKSHFPIFRLYSEQEYLDW